MNTDETTNVLRLPDEILTEIFALASGSYYNHGHHSDLISIIKTCKRFQDVAQPILYCSIRFCSVPPLYELTPAHASARKFCASLTSNAQLGSYCKSLSIQSKVSAFKFRPSESYKTVANLFEVGDKVLSMLPNVRVFIFASGFDAGTSPQTWNMLRVAFQHMPFLTELSLNNTKMHGLLVNDIIRNINLPNLEILSLHGASNYLATPGQTEGEYTYTEVQNSRSEVRFHGTLILTLR
jgi:hypothetical protein